MADHAMFSIGAAMLFFGLFCMFIGTHWTQRATASLNNSTDKLREARILYETLNDAVREWNDVLDSVPEIGARVEVWRLVDRMSADTDYGPAYGVYHGSGFWMVDGDPLAIVSHWRERPDGPGVVE